MERTGTGRLILRTARCAERLQSCVCVTALDHSGIGWIKQVEVNVRERGGQVDPMRDIV